MAQVLNLNNEVVKMRKDVKKARALIIRKLTRHITKLKSKKGNAEEVEKNKRRAGRLLEEIHAMKSLKPDQVTKAALQRNTIFEKVCKNPNSTSSERATARIASHPQISKKIIAIEAAIKAFKEERETQSEGKDTQEVAKLEDPVQKTQSVQEKDHSEDLELTLPGDTAESINQITKTEHVRNLESSKDTDMTDALPETVIMQDTSNATISTISNAISQRKSPKKNNKTQPKPQSEASVTIIQHTHESEGEESELEESDEEDKEYFDDSTEERFFKQSSMSEDSDGDDDDFFIGKVKQTKKKKSDPGLKQEKGKTEVRKSEKEDTEESRHMSNQNKLQSVFCNSLSGSKVSKPLEQTRKFQGKPQVNKGSAELNRPQFKKQLPRAAASRQFTSKVPHVQQSLHPSWEASRRRKEQQAQITAFQGKRIKFDDDN
ncbi:serum response factor-binding protein 1-like [Polyodon spathula]|uniref:serum response factor-binding protein 1-like n=1 Tax=Polyodon spathula TaxID=7913 RepID=UPI001B7E423C|nr:serum response factor-binding protein 1-like [Polyodon spathula]